MGISNDALLVYGIDLGDEVQDRILESMGEDQDDLVSWFKTTQAEEFDLLEVFTYCSYEYPMYGIGIKGMEYSSSRGYLLEINPGMLYKPDIDQVRQLLTFCARYKISGREGWFLTSMNG